MSILIRLEVSPARGTTNLGKYTLPNTPAFAVKTFEDDVNTALK
jgi:hypothetical protein